MLVQFTVGNFLSFKDNRALKLVAESLVEHEENVFSTPITDLHLLKSLVIFGQNSSGKSNMFKGLNFMRWFILNSSKDLQASEGIDVDSFRLSTQTTDEPSFFEIQIIVDDVKYRYGFKVNENAVLEEWLFQVKKIKEYPLFHRFRQQINSEDKFGPGQHEFKKLTRENALYLSVAAQFNNAIATEIIRKIRNIKLISGMRDENHIDQTARMLQEERYTKLIKDLVLSAGLGFTDIKAERITYTEEMLVKAGVPKEIRNLVLSDKKEKFDVSTTHIVYDENNKPLETTASLSLLQHESLGTQKFFSLAGPIIECIVRGGTLLVDEFSSRMSPVLCESIIRLFNSKFNNPYNAQFLFITHNTQFISKNRDIFRRDQMIYFTKDEYGATDVNSFYDLRKRKDAPYDKEYLNEIYENLPKLDISAQLSLFQNELGVH